MAEGEKRKHAVDASAHLECSSAKRSKRVDSVQGSQSGHERSGEAKAVAPGPTAKPLADLKAHGDSGEENTLEIEEPKARALAGEVQERPGRALAIPGGLLHLDPDVNLHRLLTTRQFIREFGYHDDRAVLEKVNDRTLNQVCPPHEDERLSCMDVITRYADGEFSFERRLRSTEHQKFDFHYYASLSNAEPSIKQWLRAGQAEFNTIKGYIERWGQTGAATHFDDVTLRPARDDIPALLVRLRYHTFVSIEKYHTILKQARNRPDLQNVTAMTVSKELLMLAPGGQSYLTPQTMKWKHPEAFRALLLWKGLDPNISFKSATKSPQALIKYDKDRFLSAETLQEKSEAMGQPLTSIFGREKIYLQNRTEDGELTCNFSSLLLERAVRPINDPQLSLVGMHPDWEALSSAMSPRDHYRPARAQQRQGNAAATLRGLDERPTRQRQSFGR